MINQEEISLTLNPITEISDFPSEMVSVTLISRIRWTKNGARTWMLGLFDGLMQVKVAEV